MLPRETCHALIPCLNEADRIASVVAETRKWVNGVLVVDDGSTDGTAQAAGNAGAEVVRHPVPYGKGSALRAGWRLLEERGVPWALCLDGDGQHAGPDIPRFLETADRTGADLVVGNRFATAAPMPCLRRLANRAMSAWLSRVAGRSLPDSQCGFRLMRLERHRELHLRTDRFEIESETLLAAVRAGWQIEFVPIRTVYRGERSKIRPLSDTWRWLRWRWSDRRLRTSVSHENQERSSHRSMRQPN